MGSNGIMIIGEALTTSDVDEGRPFSGAAGWTLKQILSQVGIDMDDCYLTNVFNLKAPSGLIENLCGPKSISIPGMPKLGNTKFVRAEFAPELERLQREIEAVRPTLIIALGGAAAWFTILDGRISKIRGSAHMSRFGIKVLPSYSPGAILREYSLRPILTSDMEKAARESLFPEVRRPQRFIHIEPTIEDLWSFYRRYIAPSPTLSVDIETKGGQITCIGLAPSGHHALVIPFHDAAQKDGNYWRSLEDELKAWTFLRRVLAEGKANIGQNFVYDVQYLWKVYGLKVPGMASGDDTMLMHHALQPEMQKGLAFLGSLYTDEAPWKLERKSDTIKKED